MNIILQQEILKTLLIEPFNSIYELEKTMNASKKKTTVNYPTLNRYINRLIKTGFIETETATKKGGKPDKRGTKILKLSYKGLIFLILNADLQQSEMVKIVDRILGKTPFSKLQLTKETSITNIPKESISKLVEEIRPKVNLEYFDEEYVQQLVAETLIIDLVLDQFKEWAKEFIVSSDPEKRRLKRKAKKDAKKMPSEWIEDLIEVYEYLTAKRNSLNKKIQLIKPSIKELRRIRKT